MKHNTPKISSVEKALDILRACICAEHDVSTLELSDELGYNVATVHRILQTLAERGYLQQDERTKKFRFGPVAFEIGRSVFHVISGNLQNIATPFLMDLSEKVGQTVILEALFGRSAVIVYISQGSRGITIRPRIGDKTRFHASVGAKAMLAHIDPQEWDRYLDDDLQAFTPKTIVDKEHLKKELELVKTRGVALGSEEMTLGINAMAAPIFDHDNSPVGAVVILGLVQNVACDINSPMIEELKNTAGEISARLFHRVSGHDQKGTIKQVKEEA